MADVNDIILEDLGPALDWSPDGTRIAYTDAGSDGHSVSSPLVIRVASRDGSVPPGTLASHAVFPVWSADGRRLYR